MSKMLTLSVVLATGCVHWTAADTAVAGLSLATSAIDLYQTAHYVVPRCEEENPFIGPCGKTMSPYIVLPIGQLINLGIAAVLPPKPRKYWLGYWFGLESTTVYSNWRSGYGP
jgi:hypothetical protein